MKESEWKSLSHVRLFVTLWIIAHQALLYMWILQARTLEWVATPFSRGSSQPRDQTRSPALQADSLPSEPPGKPKNTGVGSLSFLQGIFPTQEWNWSLLHCRQIDSLPAELPRKPWVSLIKWQLSRVNYREMRRVLDLFKICGQW